MISRAFRLPPTAAGLLALLMLSCGTAQTPGDDGLGRGDHGSTVGDRGPNPGESGDSGEANTSFADVTAVTAAGSSGDYTFSVAISSQETGCDQYADWWEVLDENGALLYRRVLGHSHVAEQPFTRSGGPVPVDATTPVLVRAHMSVAGATGSGYGGAAMQGSVTDGFSPVALGPEFAAGLAQEAPLPDGCAF